MRKIIIGIKNSIIGIGIVLFVAYLVFTSIMDVYENEEVYGRAYSDKGIENLLSCYKFCGSENVRFIPSTIFKQEVCQCNND